MATVANRTRPNSQLDRGRRFYRNSGTFFQAAWCHRNTVILSFKKVCEKTRTQTKIKDQSCAHMSVLQVTDLRHSEVKESKIVRISFVTCHAFS
jgi:hypothetical protein